MPIVRGGGVMVGGAGLEREEVEPSMTTKDADGPRAMVVPETVMAPPGASVWPAMTKLEPEFAVICELPMVSTGAGDRGWKRIGVVAPFTIMLLAAASRDTVLPSTVMARPGARLCPLITYMDPPGLAVMVRPPTTIWAAVVTPGTGRGKA